MKPLRCLPFRHKLNLGITLIVVFVAVLLSIYVTRLAADALLDEGKRRGTALVANLALRATDPLLSGDLLRLNSLVDDLRDVDRDVAYGFIVDEAGNVLAHTFGKTFPTDLLQVNRIGSQRDASIQLLDTGKERIYDFASRVRVGSKVLGTVRMGLSQGKILESVNDLALTISLVCSAALTVAMVISSHFARRVTARLNDLRAHAEGIVQSELGHEGTTAVRRRCGGTHRCSDKDCPSHGDQQARCGMTPGSRCPRCAAALGKDINDDSCSGCSENEPRGDEIEELAEAFDVLARSLRTRITELRATERNLLRQQELLHTILEATPDQVALLDARQRFLAVNKAFADFTGASLAELVGKPEQIAVSPVAAPQFADDTRQVLATGEPIRCEATLSRNGKDYHFHVVKVPVLDENRRIVGVLGTARDITELRDYQNQLVHSQKMESIGKLAGGVAHEINTPLGIILGYSQLLQEDAAEGSQLHGDLAIIERQAKFCRQIVADLLGFSRHTESQKKEMCFNNSIMEMISLVRHTYSLENVEIVTDLDDRLPIIWGAPDKLKQVWMNLLNNAQAALPGGGLIKVRTRLDLDTMTVTALFADTGTGIAEENRQKIFDPFFSTKPVGKGTGLGLSVSFGIIEDHQGSIEAISPLPESIITEPLPAGATAGPGTVFRVSLPLEPLNPDGTYPTDEPTLTSQDGR